MKSTDLFKKTHIYSILWLLFFVMSSIHPSYAGYGLKMKDAYLTFFIEIDDKQIAKLVGLPLEGEYYYDIRQAKLIFSPAYTENAYYVSVLPMERGLPKALFSRDSKKDGKLLLGYDTQKWSLSTNSIDCKDVYSSKELGKKLKFNMTDIARINLALAYITGQKLSHPCLSHVISKAAGNLIGLPLHSYSLLDRSDFVVESIVEDKNLDLHVITTDVSLFDDDAQAKYLETLLASPAYHSYLQTVELLGDSGITKVKALKQLLENPENRRKILPAQE
tara:strand:- start:225345 stop:226175 length:831 start_codon:yes stop_codon:yes gene_type:complete